MNEKDILNGVDGRVWLNGKKRGNCKAFEAVINLDFEDIDIPGKRMKSKKYTTASGEGSMTEHKIDSELMKLYADGIKTGNIPNIKIVGKLTSGDQSKSERVALYGVKFSKITLMKYENNKPEERELPFTFDDYEIIDTI